MKERWVAIVPRMRTRLGKLTEDRKNELLGKTPTSFSSPNSGSGASDTNPSGCFLSSILWLKRALVDFRRARDGSLRGVPHHFDDSPITVFHCAKPREPRILGALAPSAAMKNASA